MDIQKEREAFEVEFSRIKSDIAFWVNTWDEEMQGYNHPVMCWFWHMWLEAKAQAVPDTYTPIVLALEDVQSKIAQASFLTMDAENESEVYAVDANELSAYIDELIEAQESK